MTDEKNQKEKEPEVKDTPLPEERQMNLSPKRALLSLLGGGFVGLSIYVLFWNADGLGLNVFVFTLITLGFANVIKYFNSKKLSFTKWDLYLIPVLLMSLGSLINNSETMNGVTLFTLFSVWPVLLYFSIFPNTIGKFSLLNSGIIYFQQIISTVPSLADFLRSIFKIRNSDKKVVSPNSLKIILGVVIGLPITCILTAILVEADEAFKVVIDKIIEAINHFFVEILKFESLADFFVFVFFIIAGIISSVGFVFASLKFKLVDWAYERFENKGLDMVVGNIVLAMINVVFLLFVFVQFNYLFFGEGRLDELGLTYSEYARQGFQELQVVSVFVFAILYSLIRFAKIQSNKVELGSKINYLVLIATSGIMVISAMFRMWLYIDEFGLTVIRFYSYIVSIYQLIVFIYLAVCVFSRQAFKRLTLFMFVLLMSILSILALASPERLIAKENIRRDEVGIRELDADYLFSLSSDAWVQVLRQRAYTYSAGCYLVNQRQVNLDDYDWQSWSITKMTSQNTLESQLDIIDESSSSNSTSGSVESRFLSDCSKNLTEEFVEEYISLVESENFEKLAEDLWTANANYKDILDLKDVEVIKVETYFSSADTKNINSFYSITFDYSLKIDDVQVCSDGIVFVDLTYDGYKITSDSMFPIAQKSRYDYSNINHLKNYGDYRWLQGGCNN